MKRYPIMLLLLILTGCGLVSKESRFLQETQNTVQQARANLNAVERLQVQETYARDFAEAHNELVAAEAALQEQRQDQAYLAALRSQEASQRIFRQVYRDVIIPSAQEAHIEIANPNSPFQDAAPELNSILDYSDTLNSGQRHIDPAQVLADYNKIKQIGQNTRGASGKLLVAEITFAPGRYDLSSKSNHALRAFAEGLLAAKRQAAADTPGKTPVIRLKVVGYADQMDFHEGVNLQTLTKDVAQRVPEGQTERRRFLNQRLSTSRAQAISDALQQFLSQTDQENPPAQIEPEITGLGEEIPPGVSAPYPLSDQRRRVCRLQGSLTLR